MFTIARIKLTAWYLVIIMVISLSFSVAIYLGVNRELVRLENSQNARQQRVDRISTFLKESGVPLPPESASQIDLENVEQARLRIVSALGIINLSILILAGAGGYFLAGVTLDPIAKMMDEQKEFVSNASHELRTPLTSLKTEIEVALRNPKTKDKELLKSNLEEVNNMQKLSNYLLELNRYESGKEIPMTDVDLMAVALKAVGKKKIKMNLKKSIVTGNEDALAELVTILIDNAIKYGKGKTVEIRTKPDGTIEIEDHGMGIAESEIPHIFDRFYRSDKSRGTDGYGLGLSIAKSIVDLHKGKIEVESKVGKGSTFRVSF